MTYNAGACFPLFAPKGCLEQELLVKEDRLDAFAPQNLQVYCDFSLPWYKECLPLLGPFGCLEQELLVKDETLDAFAPQYSQ